MTDVSTELPPFIPPMLAESGRPFDSDAHLFEIKWDGTRALAFIEANRVRLVNRRERDISERYPDMIECLRRAPSGTVLDGELIVMKSGKPDFQSLQSREQSRTAVRIRQGAANLPATYVVFDQLYCDGKPIMDQPLHVRRERARETVARIAAPARIIMSEGVIGGGIEYFQNAEKMDLEGVIAKRLDSQYLPGKRSDCWIKIKRSQTLICAVIGYLIGDSGDLRSLILACDTDGELKYVGKAGSGIDQPTRERLLPMLQARARNKPLVEGAGKGNWVEPGLYCKVTCMERTKDGILRAPVFVELYEG